MKVNLTPEQQSKVLAHITWTIELADSQSTEYKDEMLDIYESLSTMVMPDTGDNLTRFKVNKAHEILRKVAPRVVAKPPRFLIEPRTDIFFDEDETKVKWERAELIARNNKYAAAARDFLHNIFEDEQFVKRLKLWAIKGLTYGNAFAQVVPKYKMQRKRGKNGVMEHVVWVLPTIEPVSWTEMYYDARYLFLEDMPWIVRKRKKVSLFAIYNTADYFNLEQIETLSNLSYSSVEDYADKIYQATGVTNVKTNKGIDKDDLDLEIYEGMFSLTGKTKYTKLY